MNKMMKNQMNFRNYNKTILINGLCGDKKGLCEACAILSYNYEHFGIYSGIINK